jgi:putative tryptophan/tyrosine transport system substrate-binding protein
MRRRELIAGLGATMASPLIARAQRTNGVLIGVLGSGSPESFASMMAAFRRGLAETGYVDGVSVTIDARWAEGRYDRLPELAGELVRRRVAVIFSFGGNAPTLAAKKATAEIPIVFLSGGGDAVKAGLVSSLARPGGNVTGVNVIFTALTAKRLDLLRQMVPKVDLLGVLVNPTYGETALQLQEVKDAAQTIGQRMVIVEASSEGDMESAFASLSSRHADALLIANDPFFYGQRKIIVALAARHVLPTCYYEREFAAAGGLMSYGTSLADTFRQAGVYVGRVLNGARPADLPVLQPTTFELVINLKTAKALGLAIPPALFAQADEVIE